jgi:hypothetical protein
MEIVPLIGLFEKRIMDFEADGGELKKAMSGFEKRFRPGKPDGIVDSVFLSWRYFDFRFGASRETVAERCLGDSLTAKLNEPGPTIIRRLAESYLSFHEIIGTEGDAVLVEELGTKRRLSILHVRELQEIDPVPGEIWYCRLIGPPEQTICYTSPYIYGAEGKTQFTRAIRIQDEDFSRGLYASRFPAERHFAESQKEAALFWMEYIYRGKPEHFDISSVPSAWPEPPSPLHILNTDRDDLIFTEMHFRLKDERVVRMRLTALRSFDYNAKDDSWTWLKGKSRIDPESPRTVLGSFRIKEGRLVAEANSRERAVRLEAKLSYHLSDLIFLEKTLHRHPDDPPAISRKEQEALRKQTDELNARPEVRAGLKKYLEHHYFKKWPRESIPALGGLTPLQAAKTEQGREKLKKLLDDFDRWQDADTERGYRIDFDELRRMLGLPPRAS